MTDPAPTPVPTPDTKPGWKTSELYLHVAAAVLSSLFAANVFPTGSVAEKIAIIVALNLTTLGYAVNRTVLKQAALPVLALLLLLPHTGCSASQKSHEVAALNCIGVEYSAIKAELESQDSAEQKALTISADWYACYQRSVAAKGPASEKQ